MSLPAALLLASLLPGAALAEGSAELGIQTLEAQTTVYVDILDSSVETISYLGLGAVDVRGPDGSELGTYFPGEVVVPTAGDGAYEFFFRGWQTELWDLTVNDSVSDAELGRVFSYQWRLDAQDYAEPFAFTGSFYILVEAGGPEFTNTIEMRAKGLGGYQWEMVANRTGVVGANGRSRGSIEGDVLPEYRIYLNPPAIAAYDLREPQISALTLVGGPTECSALAPGATTGTFSFDADVDGSYRIVCDLDQDGDFDPTSDDDLSLSGLAEAGTNELEWDGTDNAGNPVPPGDYDCEATLTVGEFHFVANDIETAFEGLRMFKVDQDLNRSPLAMYWNDSEVQHRANTMPNGEKGLESSGPDGLSSGAYSDATTPNRNARSWGSFEESGKGNVSLLDTYVWLADTVSGSIEVAIIDADLDSDGDGVSDIDELCVDGTDPYEVAGYFKGGCSSVPARGMGGGGAVLLGLLGLAGLRRRA